MKGRDARCQGCGTVGPHRIVTGRCACREWPLAAPEAFFQTGRCGYCGERVEVTS